VLERIQSGGLLPLRAHDGDIHVGDGKIRADLHPRDAREPSQARVLQIAQDHRRQFLLDGAAEHFGSSGHYRYVRFFEKTITADTIKIPPSRYAHHGIAML
jgi:hypothetical protein